MKLFITVNFRKSPLDSFFPFKNVSVFFEEISDNATDINLNYTKIYQTLITLEKEYERTIAFYYLTDINGTKVSKTYYLGGKVIDEDELKKTVSNYYMWTKFSEPNQLYVVHSNQEVFEFSPNSRIWDWHD